MGQRSKALTLLTAAARTEDQILASLVKIDRLLVGETPRIQQRFDSGAERLYTRRWQTRSLISHTSGCAKGALRIHSSAAQVGDTLNKRYRLSDASSGLQETGVLSTRSGDCRRQRLSH